MNPTIQQASRSLFHFGLAVLLALAGVMPVVLAAASTVAQISQIRVKKTDTHEVADSITPEDEVREAPLLPTLPAALSDKTGLSFDERLAIVHSLPLILSSDQTAALTAFVSARSGSAGLDVGEVYALKNDVINALTRQRSFSPELVSVLAGVYADPKQDAAMRDYALQHLAVIALDGSRAYKWAQHWQAVDAANVESELAATAMLHLVSASEKNMITAAQKQKLGSAALRMASDQNKPDVSRITALQACTRLKVSAVRELAYTLAQSSEAGFPLRISAIAALGDLGGEKNIKDFLVDLATSPERRLRIPAQSALDRFTLLN